VFARFTDRARNAVSRAQDEARSAGSPQVGPSHVVLGLVHEPQTLAGRCIGALGVPMDAVRAAARESLQAGENGAGEGESGDGNSGAGAAGEHVPFSAHSKKLLELTVREALRLGHNYVGTEHILLALLVDENAVLVGLGLTHSAAEQWLVATLDQARRSGGLR
jgi:ATP-dependent Clp protease ATP-binding subunit ClpA